jgi:photosystem II stability/assembly factor-like uncharacterized protein
MLNTLALLSLLTASILTPSFVQGVPGSGSGARAQSSRPSPSLDSFVGGLRYRCVGPTRGGRVTAVAGVVERPSHAYFGASGGGVWKTEDFGASWRCVSDGYFDTGSIGAIRVAPGHPDIVYVGTGSDGLRSNVIAGCGVYRSDDAGKSWRFVGLPKSGHIGALEIHPKDPDIVFVAAIGNAFAPNEERGLYRSKDGGKSWERILYVSPTCGAVDVEFAPDDPETLYASTWKVERKPWTILSGGKEGGVYRSRDGGDTWHRLTRGIPTRLFGKADLAVTRADPERVYLLIEAPGAEGGVYVSRDRGESWKQTSSRGVLRTRPFYYTNIDACPQDPDRVYVGATSFSVSSDGGRRWRQQRTPHVDNHDLWIHPENPKHWVLGNDGGATITLDAGRTWSTQDNQATAELYQVHVDTRYPYWLYAGQQDNSTIRVPSLPPWPSPAGPIGYWQSVGGCETGPVVPDPRDSDLVYANCKGRFSVFNARTGVQVARDVGAANMYGHNPKDLRYRFQRVAPIVISPHDPDVVYHASQFLHRTRDRGLTWETISPDLTAFEPDKQVISGSPITRDITGEEFYSCLYAVAESPLSKGTIWTGANDGPIHVTRDGGKSWAKVTPAGLAPGGRVQCIELSPHQEGKAYVTVLRYMLNDWQPHVYRTTDHGKSWKRISGPETQLRQDSPSRVLREDPQRAGLLYLGTDHGVWISHDDGVRWESLQLNLPVVPVTDMRVVGRDLVLSTMGRSFWILDDLTPLRAFEARLLQAELELFQPEPALLSQHRARGATPNYPAAAAVIDFWSPGQTADRAPVTLEIRDANDMLVRRFSSDRGTRERWIVETRMGEKLELREEGRLSRRQGLNRFRWDMRHVGTGRLAGRRGGVSGPRVAPGRYTLILQCGDQERRAVLEVQMDPRTRAEGITLADLEAQEATGLELRRLLIRAGKLVSELDGLIRKRGPELDAARALRKRLITAPGTYMQPQLIDQLIYLNRIVTSAPSAPSSESLLRAAEYRQALSDMEAELRKLRPRR